MRHFNLGADSPLLGDGVRLTSGFPPSNTLSLSTSYNTLASLFSTNLLRNNPRQVGLLLDLHKP